MDTLRWGIIGTGNIATTFAKSLQVAKRGKLVAIASRSLFNAQTFGHKFNINAAHVFDSYQRLLKSPEINIVYISTPHPQHYELALATAKAGKHMLIEKPMGMTLAQVETIFKVAKENNVFVMEAYMYRCHPQTHKLVELVQSHVIGDVKHIEASFTFDGKPLGSQSRLWMNELGGGAIMDIGGYPMSFARLIAGAINEGANLTDIQATGLIQQDTNVDECAEASLTFENNITAKIFASISVDGDSSVNILGTQGSLTVKNIWRPDLGPVGIDLELNGKKETVSVYLDQPDLYALEIDAVADAVFQGKKECKYMTWQDSMDQIRAIDQWRKEIGLVYKEDQ